MASYAMVLGAVLTLAAAGVQPLAEPAQLGDCAAAPRKPPRNIPLNGSLDHWCHPRFRRQLIVHRHLDAAKVKGLLSRFCASYQRNTGLLSRDVTH
eukprot:SAG31_NODE_5918_length_2256_cov_2.629578_1_plen_96_part_00